MDFADDEVGETLPWARLAESVDGARTSVRCTWRSTRVDHRLPDGAERQRGEAGSLEAFLARLAPRA